MLTTVRPRRMGWSAAMAVGLFAVGVAAGAGPGAVGRPVDEIGGYASDRVVVTFAPGLIDHALMRVADKAELRRVGTRAGYPPGLSIKLTSVLRRWGVSRFVPLYPFAFAHPQSASRLGLDRTYVLEVPTGTDTPGMAAALRALGGEVETAELDDIGTVAQLIPNDTRFSEQYGLNNTGETGGKPDADVDAPEAWTLHTGDLGTVTIAIVDTGVSPHVEFGARLVSGYNAADPSDPDGTADGCPHGTHVAGIAAATGNNGEGIAGVTWGANIMPVRVFAGSGPPAACSGSPTDTAEGIVWAVDHGADVINISLQFCFGTTSFENAVDYAHERGVLVVSAAGNWPFCGTARPFVAFPARYANSMAISATNSNDDLASFSYFGPEVDVAAPGDAILSTWPKTCVDGDNAGGGCRSNANCGTGTCTGTGDVYFFQNGTSMATPHITGLAALLMSFAPNLTHTEIRNIITSTADDKGAEGRDDMFGHGRANAGSAVLAALVPRIVDSVPPDGAIDARQPFDPDGANAAGWQWVDLTFDADTSEFTVDDFSVSQEGGVVAAPIVVGAVPNGNEIRVILSDPIAVGAWTVLTYLPSATSVRLGYLPGDVDGDGTSSVADLTSLMSALDQAVDPLTIHSFDINRSGMPTPVDLLRVVDLLQGGGSYDVFLDATLPKVAP